MYYSINKSIVFKWHYYKGSYDKLKKKKKNDIHNTKLKSTLMICEISRLNTLGFNGGWMIWKKKKKKKIIEGNQGELAKDLSMIKSNFSLELKYSE